MIDVVIGDPGVGWDWALGPKDNLIKLIKFVKLARLVGFLENVKLTLHKLIKLSSQYSCHTQTHEQYVNNPSRRNGQVS